MEQRVAIRAFEVRSGLARCSPEGRARPVTSANHAIALYLRSHRAACRWGVVVNSALTEARDQEYRIHLRCAGRQCRLIQTILLTRWQGPQLPDHLPERLPDGWQSFGPEDPEEAEHFGFHHPPLTREDRIRLRLRHFCFAFPRDLRTSSALRADIASRVQKNALFLEQGLWGQHFATRLSLNVASSLHHCHVSRISLRRAIAVRDAAASERRSRIPCQCGPGRPPTAPCR